MFKADGSPDDAPNFTVDTFKTAEARDVDGDGIKELVLRQYASIGWHANYMGDIESVWRFTESGPVLISVKLYTE